MSRQKLVKFAEIGERSNVVEKDDDRYQKLKGKWGLDFFENNQPINLELACGRGEYTVGLAKNIPSENFIGIDIKGERIWKGSTIALDENLKNAGFLRTFILQLEEVFEHNEINNIWIIHPDPRPRERDSKRRLTHHRFLDLYKRIQGSSGKILFKTDNTDLFNWTLEEVLPERTDICNLTYTHDLHNSELLSEHYGISTKYEKKFSAQGEKIKYMRFEWKM